MWKVVFFTEIEIKFRVFCNRPISYVCPWILRRLYVSTKWSNISSKTLFWLPQPSLDLPDLELRGGVKVVVHERKSGRIRYTRQHQSRTIKWQWRKLRNLLVWIGTAYGPTDWQSDLKSPVHVTNNIEWSKNADIRFFKSVFSLLKWFLSKLRNN